MKIGIHGRFGSTPSDYILAWRRVHDLLLNKNLTSTRLQWIWCVNNADAGNYTAENYWVGNNYTDWLGIDGYNFGTSQSWSTWLTPNQVFDNMLGRLRNLSSTKPICINEYGSTSIRTGNNSDINAKSVWLNLSCSYINDDQIKMASYFNTDKETDWAIFGGIHGNIIWGSNISAYSAYKDCLQSNDWIIPNNTNARIITDNQFAGQSKMICYFNK